MAANLQALSMDFIPLDFNNFALETFPNLSIVTLIITVPFWFFLSALIGYVGLMHLRQIALFFDPFAFLSVLVSSDEAEAVLFLPCLICLALSLPNFSLEFVVGLIIVCFALTVVFAFVSFN